MPRLPNTQTIIMGCDPELFLSKEVGIVKKRRSIVGSELVVPEGCGPYTMVVRDGVQVELHPGTSHCRANLSNTIQATFRTLRDILTKHEGVHPDFRQVVTLTPGELAKLTPRSRELGCQPSKNLYNRPHIQRDGSKFRQRSAAGHIHISCTVPLEPSRLVALMDVFVGNTMVLVDRDPLAAARRKTYGRAGEYRVKSAFHIEYRTLSNFWLHNYKLMSLAFGLARVATMVHIAKAAEEYYRRNKYPDYKNTYWIDAEQEIMHGVDLSKFETAINTNDFDLALENYNKVVRPAFEKIGVCEYGLNVSLLSRFDTFVRKIREAELAGKTENREYLRVWFPEDPVQHWLTKPEGHGTGWENWLGANVQPTLPTVSGVIAVPTTPKETMIVPAPPTIIRDIGKELPF